MYLIYVSHWKHIHLDWQVEARFNMLKISDGEIPSVVTTVSRLIHWMISSRIFRNLLLGNLWDQLLLGMVIF